MEKDIVDTFWVCISNGKHFTFTQTKNCNSCVHILLFGQREEKGDCAAAAQFVEEHGKVLARKVSKQQTADSFHPFHCESMLPIRVENEQVTGKVWLKAVSCYPKQSIHSYV